jgi:hypothetical protein
MKETLNLLDIGGRRLDLFDEFVVLLERARLAELDLFVLLVEIPGTPVSFVQVGSRLTFDRVRLKYILKFTCPNWLALC